MNFFPKVASGSVPQFSLLRIAAWVYLHTKTPGVLKQAHSGLVKCQQRLLFWLWGLVPQHLRKISLVVLAETLPSWAFPSGLVSLWSCGKVICYQLSLSFPPKFGTTILHPPWHPSTAFFWSSTVTASFLKRLTSSLCSILLLLFQAFHLATEKNPFPWP